MPPFAASSIASVPNHRGAALAPAEDRAEADARALMALLGRVRRGEDGRTSYRPLWGTVEKYGRFGHVSVDVLARHLRGEVLVALPCAEGGTTWFLGFDVDKRAPERLQVLARILELRGFAGSYIGTDGSSPDRGKLLAFFASAQPASAVNQLGRDILDEARRHASWGIERRDGTAREVEVRPTAGSGGILRILGRNPLRDGPVERPFHPLTGEVARLSQIAPSRLQLVREPVPVPVSPRQAWVDGRLGSGVSYADTGTRGVTGTVGIQRFIVRLAEEALRLHRGDVGAAKPVLADWVATIRAKSPDLALPSPTSKDRRNPLDRWERLFYAVVRAREKRVADITRPGGLGPSRNIRILGEQHAGACPNLVEALAEYVERRHLNPLAFAVSYAELAKRLGVSPASAHRLVQRAERDATIVVLFRGASGSPRNIKTVYALPALVPGGAEECRRRGPGQPIVVTMVGRLAKWNRERAAAVAAKVVPLRDAVDRGLDEVLPSPVGLDQKARPECHSFDLVEYALRVLPPAAGPALRPCRGRRRTREHARASS